MWPCAPVTVSAAVRLFTTASSAASTTAANSGSSARSLIGSARPAGTVLKAAKISPLPL